MFPAAFRRKVLPRVGALCRWAETILERSRISFLEKKAEFEFTHNYSRVSEQHWVLTLLVYCLQFILYKQYSSAERSVPSFRRKLRACVDVQSKFSKNWSSISVKSLNSSTFQIGAGHLHSTGSWNSSRIACFEHSVSTIAPWTAVMARTSEN